MKHILAAAFVTFDFAVFALAALAAVVAIVIAGGRRDRNSL